MAFDAFISYSQAADGLRDDETENHSRRVVEYATLIAQACGLDAANSEILRRGALLHDISTQPARTLFGH
jgi:HD-GYP domain-containing protein (c-di-GMP phosphodiesterase class II)